MAADTVTYERSVYTVWDMMGDIGGLYGTLHIIGSYVVSFSSFISGGGVMQQLISILYSIEAPKRKIDPRNMKTWLNRRQPAKLSSWSCFTCKRGPTHNKLEGRIAKELDIASFL